jgi:hypothetical protein
MAFVERDEIGRFTNADDKKIADLSASSRQVLEDA